MLREILGIYLLFFKMGAVTFGGGYAMLPILRRELVDKRGWLTEERIIDYYALSQGLPGIIAVNAAVFIGRERRGTAGGVAAALGVVSPCLVIITAIAFILSGFKDNVYVQHALAGISVCVTALILDAVLGMWKKGVKDVFGIVICLAVLALGVFTSVSPVLLVIICAVVGIIAGSLKRKKSGGEGEGK